MDRAKGAVLGEQGRNQVDQREHRHGELFVRVVRLHVSEAQQVFDLDSQPRREGRSRRPNENREGRAADASKPREGQPKDPAAAPARGRRNDSRSDGRGESRNANRPPAAGEKRPGDASSAEPRRGESRRGGRPGSADSRGNTAAAGTRGTRDGKPRDPRAGGDSRSGDSSRGRGRGQATGNRNAPRREEEQEAANLQDWKLSLHGYEFWLCFQRVLPWTSDERELRAYIVDIYADGREIDSLLLPATAFTLLAVNALAGVQMVPSLLV